MKAVAGVGEAPCTASDKVRAQALCSRRGGQLPAHHLQLETLRLLSCWELEAGNRPEHPYGGAGDTEEDKALGCGRFSFSEGEAGKEDLPFSGLKSCAGVSGVLSNDQSRFLTENSSI